MDDISLIRKLKNIPIVEKIIPFFMLFFFAIEKINDLHDFFSLNSSYYEFLNLIIFILLFVVGSFEQQRRNYKYSKFQKTIIRIILIIAILGINYNLWYFLINTFPHMSNYPQIYYFSMVLFFLIPFLYFLSTSIKEFFFHKKYVILVCELSEGASKEIPRDRHITQTLFEGLRERLDDKNFEVKYVDEIVLDKERAIHLAKNANAITVLYGYYVKNALNIIFYIKYQVIKVPKTYSPIKVNQKIISIDYLDNGQLQNFLIEDIFCLSEFLIGLFMYSENNYEKANVHFLHSLQKIEDSGKKIADYSLEIDILYLFIGNCYYQLQDLSNAKEQFEKALKYNPQSAKAMHNLAVVFYSQDDILRSLEFLSESINCDPNLFIAYRNKAYVQITQGNYKDANELLNYYIAQNPTDLEMLHLSAMCLDRLQNHKKAIDRYKSYLKKKPFDFSIQFELAREFYLNNDFFKSKLLLTILCLNPRFAEKSLGELGDYQYQIMNYEKAEYFYNKAINVNTKNANLYFSRALTYEKLIRNYEAINDYKRCITLNSSFIDAHYNLANIYFRQKKYTCAISQYSKLLSISEKIHGVFFNRGQAYFYIEEYGKAIRDFDSYIEGTNNLEKIKGLNARAIVYLKIRNYLQAISDFKASLSLMPKEKSKERQEIKNNLALSYYSYAYSLIDSGGKIESIKVNLMKALEIAPFLKQKALNDPILSKIIK